MALFNFLKKDVVLHCYTARPEVYNFAPIKKASAFLPDWWKELPKTYKRENAMQEFGTMKMCSGFTDLYSKGFIMPLWSDVKVMIGKKGEQDQNAPAYRYQFSDLVSKMGHHPTSQHNDAYPLTNYQHLKLTSPWVFACEEDIDFLQIQPFWNFSQPEKMFAPPGVVSFKYQVGTNINTFWVRENEDVTHDMPFMQPLLQYIPLTEKKVTLKLHLVSDAEFLRIGSISTPVTFLNKYKHNKKLLKTSGCPFHFKV